MKKCNNSFYLTISTPWLKPLLVLHLAPINLVVFEVSKKSNLGVGFPLICFQRLSHASLATQQCAWWHNWYTRGSLLPVLSSSMSFISKGSDYIFIPHSEVRSKPCSRVFCHGSRRMIRFEQISLFRDQSIRGHNRATHEVCKVFKVESL